MTELDFASPRVEAAARVIAEKLGGPNYGADDWGVFASVARSALLASDQAAAEASRQCAETREAYERMRLEIVRGGPFLGETASAE